MALIDQSALTADVADLLSSRPRPLPETPLPETPESESPESGTPTGRAAESTAPERELRPLSDVLAGRSSVREFTDDPLPLADLEFVLDHAAHTLRSWWPAPTRQDLGLSVLIAAYDVARLPLGIHTIGPGRSPVCLGTPGWLPALRTRYATAPALLAICGDLTWACSPSGPGYGALLTAAGTLGHATWLSALSIGLAASVYGRPCHELTELAETHLSGTRHLFTVALGQPRPAAGLPPADDQHDKCGKHNQHD